jgi:hypothetical protein
MNLEITRDRISKIVKPDYMPTIKQMETWSERMRADILRWLNGEGIEPDFMRAYKRSL